jgi:predicted enzyme related to lactoylglutathione lyase
MTDPLDALRTPVAPVDPDPEFAATLRARLLRALLAAPTQEEPMTDVLLRDGLSRNGTQAGDISYVTLALPDLARGRAFYGAVLGWTFGPGQVESVGNQVDDVIPQVGLWSGPVPSGRNLHGAVLGYRVDDLDQAVAAVRAHGGTATDPHGEPYGLAAECVDDQGVEFFLHQLPPAGRRPALNGVQPGDISYVSLIVGDPAAAHEFYGAVLGWQLEHGSPQAVPQVGFGRGERAGAVLCFRVDDIAAAVARVRAAGGSATDPVQRPYALESDCADDQNIPFYLHQFPS